MFGFKKTTSDTDQLDPSTDTEAQPLATESLAASTEAPPSEEEESSSSKPSLFTRLKQGLNRTRESFTSGLTHLLLGKKAIDDELLEEIETLLLTADLGVEATQTLVKSLTEQVSRQQLTDSEALLESLRTHMQQLLEQVEKPLSIPVIKTGEVHKPFVILMVGVNGAGKTTTIGKLAKRLQAEGRSVMLAAGDTFRAAAVEQLKVWGERNGVPVVAQHDRADSAAVIFDALQSATAKKIDVLIADTAGRLHTQSNLMEELKKVRRVMSKLDTAAPHEVMLVVDAGIGQNALVQAQQFDQAVNLTGITLTKLDGTAKGGIVFAIAQKTDIPIRFIGVGERVDDLRVFNAEEFVQALLSRE